MNEEIKNIEANLMEDSAPGLVKDSAEVISVKKALDGYSNPAANLGVGTRNLSQTGGYILQRLSWDYLTLNALFRNNWIAKAIIEKPANEMLKNGFQIHSELDPDKITDIEKAWERTKTNSKFLECLKWARLYGGCVMLPMIEGQQNLSEPLDLDSIPVDGYKGSLIIDRWQGISPSLEVEEDISDPEFGQPKYYLISSNEMQKTVKVHHSRIIKMIGRKLPYWEEVAESFWGASELEHVFTELKKRDDTSANISFLIFLANIRIFKMQDLGQMITLGDQQSLKRVYNTLQEMNSLMCNTGTMAMDSEDDFTMQGYTFTGINDIYESFMLDIAGAAEIPVDKLFGRSPSGFNNGNETLQNYYDTIQEKQETYIREPLEKIIKILAMSTLGKVPDDIEIVFNPVRRPSDMEKADLGSKNTEAILSVKEAGIIGKGTALRELKQQADISGLWTNITDKMIEDADKEDEEEKQKEKEEKDELESGVNEVLNSNEDSEEMESEEETEKGNKGLFKRRKG